MHGRIRRAQSSPYLRLEVSNEAPEPVCSTPFYHPRALAGIAEINSVVSNISAILEAKGAADGWGLKNAPPHVFHDPVLALEASQVALRSVLTHLGVAYDIGIGGFSTSAGRWVQHLIRLLPEVPAASGLALQDTPDPGEFFELRWPSDESVDRAIRHTDMPELTNRALAAACLYMTAAYDTNMVCALAEPDRRKGLHDLGLPVVAPI